VGAARVVQARRDQPSAWLALRGLGLVLYAIALFYAVDQTHFSMKPPSDQLSLTEHGPRIARNALHIYAFNAAPIFLAAGLLRLVGYDLGSGFRFPWLSTSPSDFFRRWNYYFFEFANAAIFMPAVSRLRRWLPLWIAYIIGAYLSFCFGVWALGIVENLPSDYLGHHTIKDLTNPYDVRVHVVMWTMVIGAQLLLMPFRRWRHRWWSKLIGHLVTLALAIAGLLALFISQNRIY
jgi:D-alanyl-lipoteichoic acid acyltransferase DltB (MBOAT superfamily)